MKWFTVFFAALIVGIVVFGVAFIWHDQSVTCHTRVRKSDDCWKDLNEKVRNLEVRVHDLEQR